MGVLGVDLMAGMALHYTYIKHYSSRIVLAWPPKPPDSTGVWGVRDRETSIWGISRALDGQNTVSQLLLLGTTATKGVPTGD